ncbi:MAG: carbohydrate-binding domain-containing protein [Treponema sp.]|nr:carbohydrate-binding domain-containing protein [Treponema sp.]
MKKNKFFAALLFIFLLTGCTREVPASGIINQRPAQDEITAVSAKPVEFINGVSRITTGGRYRLSGEHEGQILIDASRNDIIELILDGAVLHNPSGQAIFAPRSRGVELILADGTINYVSDGEYIDENNNAAIYIQHDLIISGGGTLNVTGNYHHGIRAQDFLTINSGYFQITAKGDSLRGRDGVIINDGIFLLTAGGDGIQSNNNSNPDYGFITINGGTFTINAGDDGMQAETNVTINGGIFMIEAGDDGITAGSSVLITGGKIDIKDSYEGIEGLNVTITGGDIALYARDDGINARDPNAIRDFRGRPMTRGPFNPEVYVRITGGNINVHAVNDGIDSNNNIFLEGGTVNISGPSRGMDGAVDLDGTFLITGGKLITSGSVINVSRQSTQSIVSVVYTRQLPAGTLIEILGSNGSAFLNHTSQMTFTTSFFTAPDFINGETYSLYINGEKTNDFTISSLITSVSGNSSLAGAANENFVPRGTDGGFTVPGRGSMRAGPGFSGENFPNVPSPGDFGGGRGRNRMVPLEPPRI